VFDSVNKRISKWSERGTFEGDLPLPRKLDHPMPADDPGTFYFLEYFMDREYRSTLASINLNSGQDRIIHELNLEGKRQLTRVPHPRSPDNPITFFLDWDCYLHYGRGSDFLVANTDAGASLVWYNLSGEKLRSVTTKLPKIPVVDEHVTQIISRLPKQHQTRIRAHLKRPDHWPVIQDIKVDERDRVWVFGYAGRTGQLIPYNLYSSEGVLLSEGAREKLPVIVHNAQFYFIYADQDEEMILERRTVTVKE
jgi:hypothetical protein